MSKFSYDLDFTTYFDVSAALTAMGLTMSHETVADEFKTLSAQFSFPYLTLHGVPPITLGTYHHISTLLQSLDQADRAQSPDSQSTTPGLYETYRGTYARLNATALEESGLLLYRNKIAALFKSSMPGAEWTFSDLRRKFQLCRPEELRLILLELQRDRLVRIRGTWPSTYTAAFDKDSQSLLSDE